MVKYHKKVNKETLKGWIYLAVFILSFTLIIPHYSIFAIEQYDRMLIDDGGNTSGGSITNDLNDDSQKQQESTLKKTLDKIYVFFGLNYRQNRRIITPVPTHVPASTPGLSPNPGQPTNPPAGYTPNLPATTGLTQLADRIVSTVRANCIDSVMGVGSVSVRNAGCLDSLIGIINTAAVTELRFTDREKQWTYLQCVACARAMSIARNKTFAKGADYAKNFKNVVTDGYKYYPNNAENVQQHLIPGSLGIYTGGSSGHIYYITEVKRDTTGKVDSVRAFECNYGPEGSVRHNVTRTIFDKELSGWQKPI